jgi:uncharacterized membrane protein HdeD (DUF308 family)
MLTAQTARRRRAFAWGLEALITALGALAIIGPEPAGVTVVRTLGVLLMLASFLGLLSILQHRRRRTRRAALAWCLVAFGVGAAMELMPANGLASLGVLIGLLLVAQGLAAGAGALPHFRARTWASAALAAVAGLLVLIGLAFLFGEDPGLRWEEIVIGVDIALFGLYLTLGRELIEAQARPPSPPAS